jgi:hypothetical protein
MHRMQKIMMGVLFAGLALVWSGYSGARAEVLITADEAKLPASSNVALPRRGLTRGPGIEQESPASNQAVRSPLSFKVKFEPRNKVAIDPASARLVYLKAAPVDLTGRIKSHVTADGIVMDQAEVPPGVHLLRLDVKDLQGREATAVITITVADK